MLFQLRKISVGRLILESQFDETLFRHEMLITHAGLDVQFRMHYNATMKY